jgi:hypothetical protein
MGSLSLTCLNASSESRAATAGGVTFPAAEPAHRRTARCRSGRWRPSRPAGTRVRVRSTHRLATPTVHRPPRAMPGRWLPELPARLANSLSNRETLTPGLAGPRSDPSSPQLAVGPGRSCRASLLPTTRQGHWDSLSLSGGHWSTARDEPHLFSDDSRPQSNWAQVPVDVAGLPSRTRPHAISKPHWRNHSQGSLRSPAPVWLPRLSIMKPGRLPDCAAPLLSGSVTQRG